MKVFVPISQCVAAQRLAACAVPCRTTTVTFVESAAGVHVVLTQSEWSTAR